MTAATHARALVLETPRHLVERAFELPEIGDDDGLLRVEACGLCGTDHEQYTGQLHPGRPFVPGHETVGIVEELGAAAAERWGVQRGDRVAVQVFQSCRECAAVPARRPPALQAARHGHHVRVPGHRGRRRASGAATPPTTTSAPTRCSSPSPTASTRCSPPCSTRSGPASSGASRCPARSAGDRVAVLGPGHPRALRVRGGQGRRRRVRDGHRRRRARPPAPRGGRALRRRPGGRRDRGGPGRRLPAGHRLERRRRRRRRHRQRPRRVRAGVALARAGGTVRGRRHPGRAGPPASTPTTSSTRSCASSARSASTPTAYRAALDLLARGRFPFAELRRQEVAARRRRTAAAGDGRRGRHRPRSTASSDPPHLRRPRCRNPRSRSATTRALAQQMLEDGHKWRRRAAQIPRHRAACGSRPGSCGAARPSATSCSRRSATSTAAWWPRSSTTSPGSSCTR